MFALLGSAAWAVTAGILLASWRPRTASESRLRRRGALRPGHAHCAVSQEGTHIEGSCADRFSGVRQAFADNFAQRNEVGASVAVTLDGELVVDLWGGHADEARTTPWTRDTIAGVASTSKTVTALCALVLADRGELDLDAPIARYWPEFARAGKAGVLVRHALGHTAALPGWTEKIAFEDLYDWEKVTDLLAGQAPWWPPGEASAYHAITHGYLVGEVVRRITGQTLGRFLADEVAGPLGADFHIGLDPADHRRVAQSIATPTSTQAAAQTDPASVFVRIADNPRLPALGDIDIPRWLSAEIPASNGVGNARSVAKLQSVLAGGGAANGRRLLSREGCEAVLRQQSDGVDRAFLTPMRWAMGFALDLAGLSFGPRTCFWGGSGGSLVVVDLERRMSFAYVMNRMVGAPFGDPRNVPLIAATYAALRDGRAAAQAPKTSFSRSCWASTGCGSARSRRSLRRTCGCRGGGRGRTGARSGRAVRRAVSGSGSASASRAASVSCAKSVAGVQRGFRRHVALAHRALHQQPRGDLHQAGGEAHALGGVGKRRAARQQLGVLAAGPVEIGGRLLDEIHAFLEGAVEEFRPGEPGNGFSLPDWRGLLTHFAHDVSNP